MFYVRPVHVYKFWVNWSVSLSTVPHKLIRACKRCKISTPLESQVWLSFQVTSEINDINNTTWGLFSIGDPYSIRHIQKMDPDYRCSMCGSFSMEVSAGPYSMRYMDPRVKGLWGGSIFYREYGPRTHFQKLVVQQKSQQDLLPLWSNINIITWVMKMHKYFYRISSHQRGAGYKFIIFRMMINDFKNLPQTIKHWTFSIRL